MRGGSTPQKGKLWKSLQSLLNSKRSFYVLKNIEIYHLQIWRLLFNICCGSQDTKARQLFEFSIRRDWTDLVHLKEYEICNRYLIDISIHLWAGVMKVQILSRRGQLHKKTVEIFRTIHEPAENSFDFFTCVSYHDQRVWIRLRILLLRSSLNQPWKGCFSIHV